MYRLDMYSGASLLRSLYMNTPFLYSSCFCRLIILISFNFWSVVRVLSGRINFTALLCREFNLFLRISQHPSHTDQSEREEGRGERGEEGERERGERGEREREMGGESRP